MRRTCWICLELDRKDMYTLFILMDVEFVLYLYDLKLKQKINNKYIVYVLLGNSNFFFFLQSTYYLTLWP